MICVAVQACVVLVSCHRLFQPPSLVAPAWLGFNACCRPNPLKKSELVATTPVFGHTLSGKLSRMNAVRHCSVVSSDKHTCWRWLHKVPDSRMTRHLQLFQASVLLVVTASWMPGSAQPDYLASISAPAGAACGDTAPDCTDVCKAHNSSAGACQLQSRIGDYLRCACVCAPLLQRSFISTPEFPMT